MPATGSASKPTRRWLEARKQRGERLLDITEASPQIRNALDRAGRFLSLASLVAVLLCAIAVAMAARRYVQRHLDSVALMKTLGATPHLTLSVSLLQLLVVAIGAALLGSAIGFGAQEWLLRALKGLLQAELPPPDFTPVGLGFLTAIAVLAALRCRRCCSCRACRRCACCAGTSVAAAAAYCSPSDRRSRRWCC